MARQTKSASITTIAKDILDGIPVVRHPLYNTWKHMRQRCHSTYATEYHRYGARGITVCDRWRNSFRAFVVDMGERPDGMTLDRIDNSCGYFLANCRWATVHAQAANRRKNNDVVGVYWNTSRNMWSARLMVNRKLYFSTFFSNKQEAVNARRELEMKYMAVAV